MDDLIITKRAMAVSAWEDLGSPRLGLRGYLCVLAYLKAGPATTMDVAEAFGTGRQRARELVSRMGELGMAHTVGKVRTGRSGPLAPLWLYGPGEVDRAGCACRESFHELMHLRRIIAAFQDPTPVKHATAETGAADSTVREILSIAKRLGMAHILAWDIPSNQQGGGVPVACWVFEPGRDAARPRRSGGLLAGQRWRAAQRAKTHALTINHALATGGSWTTA